MDGKVQPTESNDAGKPGGERGMAARLDAIMGYWSRNGRLIAKPLKTTFFCFFAFVATALIAQDFLGEYRNLNQRLETTVSTARAFLHHQEKVGAAGLEKVLLGLSANPQLIDAFEDSDPYALQRMTSALFPEMKDQHQIAEFAIFDRNRTRLINAHKAITRQQRDDSFLLKLASETETVTRGFEIGDNGSTLISVVRPWTSDGRLLGFLQLGIEIKDTLGLIGTTLNADVVETLHASQLVPGSPAEGGNGGWTRTTGFSYREAGDFEMPTSVRSVLEGDLEALSRSNHLFLEGRRVHIAYNFPVILADGTPGSSLVLFQDITDEVLSSLGHTATSLLLVCMIAAVAGTIVYKLIQSLQTAVIKTRTRLEEAVLANTQALNHSRARLIEAQKIASLGSWERDPQAEDLFWSDEMYRISGISKDLPPREARKQLYEQIPPDERDYVREQLEKAVEECREFDFEHHLVRPEGTIRRVQVRGYVIADSNGKAIKVLGTTHDITDHYNAKERSNRLANILEASLNEIYIYDTETLTFQYANQCARDNVGFELDELQGMPVSTITARKSDQQMRDILQPLLDGKTSFLSIEGFHKRRDGSIYPVEARIQLHKHQNKPVFVAICNDLTERTARELETQAAREAAERIAYFDELTGLPNRAACQRDATELFSEARDAKPAFIIHLDIDNFKRINDTLGHGAGDACLEEAGERLRMCCVGLGTAYRWGGDEFVIIALDGQTDPEELCQRVNIVLRAPMEFDGNQIWPSVSIGVARCPCDGDDFSTLLVHADLALYRSKEDGKDRWSFFTSDMKIDSDEEARTEKELREALRNDEFFLVFQPQVNIRTQIVTGIEALVRWQHPTRGILGPGAFLPVVEKSNLATPLGQAVIDKALRAARSWQDDNIGFGRVAVNLSPSHLTSGTLVNDFTAAMEKYGVEPEFVTAEVLESVFLDNQRNNNSEVLETLHNLGVHIELDDFGTGYASLSHVADLPINGLKIDRSFTNKILTDAKKEIVVNHLIHLARALDINIVCEGVETSNQFERLRLMGNFSVQGYYIARPMAFDDVTAWLNSGQQEVTFGVV